MKPTGDLSFGHLRPVESSDDRAKRVARAQLRVAIQREQIKALRRELEIARRVIALTSQLLESMQRFLDAVASADQDTRHEGGDAETT